VLLVLAVAGVWSVHLARADVAFREQTPQSIARASTLLPQNTKYLALVALQTEYDGGDATAMLERIARLNPTASAPRLQLGLAAEQRGDFATAERWLREAYEVDHQFETRWTLANFHLRQNHPAEFWRWIYSALEVSYGDRTPAFNLCWRMSDDAAEILDRAIPPNVTTQYLIYVMTRHPDATTAAALRAQDPEWLLHATDQLLDQGRYADALAVWEHAGRAKPQGITGPRFEPPQTGQGFDWREIPVVGVSHSKLDDGRGHRIRLNGKQPEATELLRQHVGGLKPGAAYRVNATFAGDKISGLDWRVNGTPSMEFRAPSESVILSLWYQRPLGQVRAEGNVDVTEVKLSPLQ
jgi:tetratricopeptide (TPR) repeat protein